MIHDLNADASVQADVSRSLRRCDELAAAVVEVDVQDGEVTLTGMVDDEHARFVAEDVARRVMGVRLVKNKLDLKGDWDEERAALGTEFGSDDGVQAEGSVKFDPID